MILKGGMVTQSTAYFGPIGVSPVYKLFFIFSLVSGKKSEHGHRRYYLTCGYRDERKSQHGPQKTTSRL